MSIYGIYRATQNDTKSNERISDNRVDDIELNTFYKIIGSPDSIDELESEYHEYEMMTNDMKMDSDDLCMSIYGMTNPERYDKLKRKFLGESAIIKDENNSPDEIIEQRMRAVISAKEWMKTSLYFLIIPTDSLEDLELQYSNFQRMTPEQQRTISDPKELELFGCTNQEMYDRIKSTLVELSSTKEPTDNHIVSETNTLDINADEIDYLPMLTPEDMEDLGVFGSSNYYSDISDNNEIADGISSKKWFDEYKSFTKGIRTENFDLYNKYRLNTLNRLYVNYEDIKESGDIEIINKRKQSILELGWNPECDFNIVNLEKAKIRTLNRVNDIYSGFKIIDLSKLVESEDGVNIAVNENKIRGKDLYPIYVVLTYTDTVFANITKTVTKAVYTHAAIGFDSSLKKLYTYNLTEGGFGTESIDKYKNLSDKCIVSVYALFLDKKDNIKLKDKLDHFIEIKKDTKYNIKGLFTLLGGIPVSSGNNMICSQFVDHMLKTININITKKDSSLVTPKDLEIGMNNKYIYNIYNGSPRNYKTSKVSSYMNKLTELTKYVKESTLIKNDIPVVSVLELKESPIQFDQDGNLLIKNMKKLDFESEYSKSHKLLLSYEKSNNIEGMKYEIAKMYFLTVVVEREIHKNKITEDRKKELYKVRARLINDFKKYLDIILNEDSNFNFTKYYEDTPFSDATIKIDKTTLHQGALLFRNLMGIMLK